MIDYRAPVDDILFALESVAGASRIPGWDSELTKDILANASRFVNEAISPIDHVADAQGVRFQNGRVELPHVFHKAFHLYKAGGWQSLAADVRYGGQGVSGVVASAFSEMMAGACIGFHMGVSLAQGAIRTLSVNADEETKDRWIPRLTSCDWLATMCLTEPQAGSDLSLIRTVAHQCDDGWRIDGSKIFISGGDQDYTGRVLHLVLARTADAPPGLKGLSLFLVPSHLENGAANGVSVVRVEDKMGLHAAATCQMAFDGATGAMVGAPGEGLKRMFTLMYIQRLEVALQGVALANCASQRSLAYAANRKQGRDPQSGEAVAISEHDDVRRMLMTQMALTLGGRVMCYQTLVDLELNGRSDFAEFMTPVCKSFCTDAAVESAHLAIQAHGGYGYLKEYRVEQILRDARITQIYEGTNEIHGAALATRLSRGPRYVEAFERHVQIAIDEAERRTKCLTARTLEIVLGHWRTATDAIARYERPDSVARAYMLLTGLTAFGAAWACLECVAEDAPEPVRIKELGWFVREFMLPAAEHHARMVQIPLRFDHVPPVLFATK